MRSLRVTAAFNERRLSSPAAPQRKARSARVEDGTTSSSSENQSAFHPSLQRVRRGGGVEEWGERGMMGRQEVDGDEEENKDERGEFSEPEGALEDAS